MIIQDKYKYRPILTAHTLQFTGDSYQDDSWFYLYGDDRRKQVNLENPSEVIAYMKYLKRERRR